MIGALGRLLAISSSVLILFVVAVFLLRWLGFQQTYAVPPHPWFQMEQWNIALPTPPSPCVSDLPTADRIVYEHVTWTKDGWQTACHVPLATRLGESSQRDWLLQVDMAGNADLDQLVRTVSAFDKEKYFAVYAPAQQVARYLRKQAPQWLFAADSGTLLRLHLFASLWLEPVLEFWPDFVLVTGNPNDGSQLNEREIQELRRRKRYAVPFPRP